MPISAFPRHLTVSSYLSCSTSKRFKFKSSSRWYYVCILKSVKNTITNWVAFRYSTVLPEYLSVRSPTGNTKAEKILALLQHRLMWLSDSVCGTDKWCSGQTKVSAIIPSAHLVRIVDFRRQELWFEVENWQWEVCHKMRNPHIPTESV